MGGLVEKMSEGQGAQTVSLNVTEEHQSHCDLS